MEKKKMKLWKKILLVLLAIFLLFSIYVIRNFIIIFNIVNVAKEYATKTNYLVNMYSVQNNNISIMKSYNKDGKYLTVLETKVDDVNEIRKLTKFRNEIDSVAIIQAGDKKYAMSDDNVLGSLQVVTFGSITDMNILQKFLFSAIIRINTDECNSKECYYMEMADGWKLWVDKENGTIIREINGGFVTERKYEFDVVKDEDIVKPDISDCEIQND